MQEFRSLTICIGWQGCAIKWGRLTEVDYIKAKIFLPYGQVLYQLHLVSKLVCFKFTVY